jgi:tetratricopeptide (TPR) repeat protein
VFVSTVLISLLVVLGMALRRKQSGFEKQLKHGLSHLKSGDFAEAHVHFQQALATSPGEVRAVYGVGLTAFKLRQYAEALVLFEQCLDKAPGFSEGWFRYGECLIKLQRTEDAATAFGKALKTASTDADVELYTGIISALHGDFSSAVETFTALLAKNPSDSTVLYNRACCFSMMNDAERAVADLQRAVQLTPTWRQDINEDWSFENIRDSDGFKLLAGDTH